MPRPPSRLATPTQPACPGGRTTTPSMPQAQARVTWAPGNPGRSPGSEVAAAAARAGNGAELSEQSGQPESSGSWVCKLRPWDPSREGAGPRLGAGMGAPPGRVGQV